MMGTGSASLRRQADQKLFGEGYREANMADSNKEAHALFLLHQALQETEIEERNLKNQVAPFFGGMSVYWQTADDDIELAFRAHHWQMGDFNASFLLKRTALDIATLFPDDAEAVGALVDWIEYIKGAIHEILPLTRQDLLIRASNVRIKDKQVRNRLRLDWFEIYDKGFEERRKGLRAGCKINF
jgi:hypothetical protein